jgi:hypothetical protein
MKDREVTEYIEKQKSLQKEILKKLRTIIHKTIKPSGERMAWGVPAFKQGKFYIGGLKDSVNLGFAIKGLKKEEIKQFKGAGKTMRHLKFKDKKEINEKEIMKLLRLVNKKATCASCVK